MDDNGRLAYGAWPERLVIIEGGKVQYYGMCVHGCTWMYMVSLHRDYMGARARKPSHRRPHANKTKQTVNPTNELITNRDGEIREEVMGNVSITEQRITNQKRKK